MKSLFRITIILGVALLGEVLSGLLPLPIPGSVYGLVLMLLALATGVIPLEKVEKEGKLLLDIMPVMFIPAAVGLINSWSQLKGMLLPVGTIMVVSTFVVMAAAGWVTQAVIRRGTGRKEDAK